MQDIDNLRELLEGVARRDPAACTRLLEYYSPYVHQVVRAVLHNHEDSEEVTQDVMLKVIQQVHRFNYRNRFSTWIYRIARNAAISLTRTPQFRLYAQSEDIDEHLLVDESVEGEGEGEGEGQGDAERWNLILSALQPDERALLVMHYSQQLPLAEVAAVLGSTEGAVKVRLHRLRRRLRRDFGTGGKEEDNHE
ncbi:MAG: RNA polymerase sigma factor [Gammaproteobacteria bacterium AqS3]|nr:RNA polymerase sigma factor [Gammaproteobacteria bacterium AqS3]